MKKFYCPYCGEKSLTFNQKFCGEKTITPFNKTANNLWFCCEKCGNQISHKSTEKSKKYYSILIPIILILVVVFFASVIFKIKIKTIISIVLIMIVSFFISIIRYKYDAVIRIGEYNDTLTDITLKTKNKDLFYEESIYIIKPSKNDEQKSKLNNLYIVAFSNFSNNFDRCKIRFVKPHDAKEFVENCKSFEIYDEFNLIGIGNFVL